MKYYVTIEIEVDDGCASLADCKEYVEDAVRRWGGQHHPDSPFFGDNKTVRIGKSGRVETRERQKLVKRLLTP